MTKPKPHGNCFLQKREEPSRARKDTGEWRQHTNSHKTCRYGHLQEGELRERGMHLSRETPEQLAPALHLHQPESRCCNQEELVSKDGGGGALRRQGRGGQESARKIQDAATKLPAPQGNNQRQSSGAQQAPLKCASFSGLRGTDFPQK